MDGILNNGYKVFQYTFNQKQFILIRIGFELTEKHTDYNLLHRSSIIDVENIHHIIIAHCQKLVDPDSFNIIIYSVRHTLKNIFKRGFERKFGFIMANMINSTQIYHSDSVDLEIDNFFKTQLEPLLIDRMPKQFIPIYLTGLRNSIIKRNPKTDAILLKYKIKLDYVDSEYIKLYEHVKNLRRIDIDAIINNILNNEINHSTSSNVFNLHKTGPGQQHALNLKKASMDDDDKSSINDSFKIFQRDCNDLNTLTSGNTYVISTNSNHLISIEIPQEKFMLLLKRNFILFFRIKRIQLGIVYSDMIIEETIFKEFCAIVNTKNNLVQFQILPITDFNANSVSFETNIRSNGQWQQWQCGNATLLGMVPLSEETLMSIGKTFDIYVICCLDFIKKLIDDNITITFKIRRVIQMGNFKFFYVLFTIPTVYAKTILTDLYPAYQNRVCRPIEIANSAVELLWSDRRCCTLIYHTHFKWLNSALVDGDEINKTVFLRNLINYKYIRQTGNLNVEPETVNDAIVAFQVFYPSINLYFFIYKLNF